MPVEPHLLESLFFFKDMTLDELEEFSSLLSPMPVKNGDVIIKEFFFADKLEYGTRAQSPGPTRIERGLIVQHKRDGEAAGDPGSVTDAPGPHIDIPVPGKEVAIGLHEFLGRSFNGLGDLRIVFIAKGPVPDGTVYNKETDGVIVIRLFQIPAIA